MFRENYHSPQGGFEVSCRKNNQGGLKWNVVVCVCVCGGGGGGVEGLMYKEQRGVL